MGIVVEDLTLPDSILRPLRAKLQKKFEISIPDERPAKRRKTVKGGQRSLTIENGISAAGIPVGYIPLARLTLRMKPSAQSIPKFEETYRPELSTDKYPVLISFRSVSSPSEVLNNQPLVDLTGGGTDRLSLVISRLDGEELILYTCEDSRLLDVLAQVQRASRLAHVDRFFNQVPTACYQAHLSTSSDDDTVVLDTVILWRDSLEAPDLNRLEEAELETFTTYVVRERCVPPLKPAGPREYRNSMLGTPENGLLVNFTKTSTFPGRKKVLGKVFDVLHLNHNGEILPMKEVPKSDLPASFHAREDADGRTYYFSQLFMVLTTDLSQWYHAADHLKGGILAEEMGLGKTVEMMALISLNKRKPQLKTDPDGLKPTGATLIITPPAILEQWKQELKEHAPALRVHHYTGIRRGQEESDDMIVDELAEFDVVLTTYHVIAKEIHYAAAHPQRSLRHEKRFEQRKTPLVRLSWWRVCLDEAQMIESGVSNAAKVARLIPRENAWAVTGTPLRRNIDDLFGLFLFLHYQPYCFSSRLWKRLCACFGPVLAKIINQITLRHSKSQLFDELRLPPQKRIVITMPFTAVEEQHYKQLFEEMCEQCGLNTSGGPLRDDWNPEDPAIVERMRTWLTRLRQTCLHPEVSGSNRLARRTGPLRTVDQVLEVMIDTNMAAIRAEERSLLLSQLRRGQLLENARRRQEALALWQKVLDYATELVNESREQLRLMKANDTVSDSHGTSDDEDAEEADKNSRLGQCRLRLRGALEVQHIAVFFTANAYYQIKSDANLTQPDSDEYKALEKREEDGYEAAKVIRKEMLTDISRKVEHSMQRIKTKARDKKFTTIPKMKPQLYSRGVESYNLLNKFEDLCTALNKHAEQYKDWRDVMVKLVSQSLIDQEEEAELEGDEYERSTKHQDEMYVYMEALRSMYADRHDALTGQKNQLISHEVKVGMIQARKGEGPSPELFLKIMNTRSELMPDPSLGSLRTIVAELRSLVASLEWQASAGNSRARAEHEMVELVLKNAGQMVAEQLKVSSQLQREVEMFRDTMNGRLEYYRHLQQISDTVAPYDEESVGKPLDEELFASKVAQEKLIDAKIASLKSKARYLLHLKDDSTSDSTSRTCIICQSTFEIGVLTVCGHKYCSECLRLWWAAHKNCPVCKRSLRSKDFHQITYKPQELVAQEEKSHIRPEHEGHSHNAIYSDISSSHLNEIKNVELDGSYGTKIDTLARHVIWLREHDPGAKSIIFSQYGNFLDILQAAFHSFGIVSTDIDSPDGIERFKKDPAVDCFLLHGKAQSSGLNLINATHVFLCEPLINTAIELQAIARVHRIGQHRPTTVWMYLVSDTVEESIYELSVTRRLAHIIEKEKDRNAAALSTPADGNGLSEAVIESANSMEMQDATLVNLMQRGLGGEVVKKDDLWQCLFGNTARKSGNDRSAEKEREIVEHPPGVEDDATRAK
ncbi:Zinc finger RING-type [Penicillium sp. DV-2018c]|nr:Zinc finger RING-type [Penicillium sp. DV-2018c]